MGDAFICIIMNTIPHPNSYYGCKYIQTNSENTVLTKQLHCRHCINKHKIQNLVYGDLCMQHKTEWNKLCPIYNLVMLFQLVTDYQQNLGYSNPQFGQASHIYQQQQQEQQQAYQSNNQQFTAQRDILQQQQQQQASSQQALTNEGLVAYFQQVCRQR